MRGAGRLQARGKVDRLNLAFANDGETISVLVSGMVLRVADALAAAHRVFTFLMLDALLAQVAEVSPEYHEPQAGVSAE